MNKNLSYFLSLMLVVPVLVCCEKEKQTLAPKHVSEETLPIVFGISRSPETKVAQVTSLSTFRASATTGAAGSEASVWNNATFAKDGATTDYKGDKLWPNSTNPSYHFYASNADITFAAGGSTVNATNSTDVVCAYMASPVYKSKNTLTFEHVFARLGNVTVTAASGYTISGVSITVTPKTGGTYNIRTGAGKTDGTGWSSITTGSPTPIAGATPGTMPNDLYLVPGTYTLTASWYAMRGDYAETISGMTSDVTLIGGKVNNLNVTLGGNAKEIVINVSVVPWENVTLDIALEDIVPKFGGFEIAPGNLYYDGASFQIADEWNHDSYSLSSGMSSGSYYFSFIELGQFFDSRGDDFSATSGEIDNNGSKVSYGGHDDWRLPTEDEIRTLVGMDPRPGAWINGVSGWFCYVEITGASHAGKSGPAGMLFFPDGFSITGKSIVTNSAMTRSYLTVAELDEYINQGCAFLPASGYEYNTRWFEGGTQGAYLSASQKSGSDACILSFKYTDSAGPISGAKNGHWPVRLIR